MKCWSCANRYNDVIFSHGPITSALKWKYMYTWVVMLFHLFKKRQAGGASRTRNVNQTQSSRAQLSSARLSWESELKHVLFNFIYLRQRFICIVLYATNSHTVSPVCAQCKAFQQTIIVVQIRFSILITLARFFFIHFAVLQRLAAAVGCCHNASNRYSIIRIYHEHFRI